MAASQRQYATGKRKYAIARAWVEPGAGEITINGRELSHYFTLLPHQVQVTAPFQVTDTWRIIAERFYGRGDNVAWLQALNTAAEPQPGTRVRVPLPE